MTASPFTSHISACFLLTALQKVTHFPVTRVSLGPAIGNTIRLFGTPVDLIKPMSSANCAAISKNADLGGGIAGPQQDLLRVLA
jgi:hypothetical protein